LSPHRHDYGTILIDTSCIAAAQAAVSARNAMRIHSVTRVDVIARLVPLMEDIFDEDDLVYSDSLTADDVAEWDSLSHIRFMVGIERAFGIRFATGEIEHFKNVGDLVTAITTKTAA
jgi:acyl carrier protein